METILDVGLSNAAATTVLAGMAALLSLRSRRPALAHGLWLLVLLKLVTPPLVRIPIVLPATPSPRLTAPMPVELPGTADLASGPSHASMGTIDPEDLLQAVSVTPDARPPHGTTATTEATVASSRPSEAPQTSASLVMPTVVRWDQLLLVVWVTGSAGWFLLAAWRVECFHRLLRYAQAAPAGWQRRADALAREMGLARSPPVFLVPGCLPPMLWAVGRPRLLLPVELLEQVGPEPLEALLAHELAHLCRRDHWVRVLEFVALGLYWWLPVAWYARYRLHEAEEQCCDAWVIATLPGSGKVYASAILNTLDFLSCARAGAPLLASGLGQVTDLKRRLRMIMTGTTPRALSWRGCLAVLTLGVLLLPLLPAWVQGEQREERERPRPAQSDFSIFEALAKGEQGEERPRPSAPGEPPIRREPPLQNVSDKVKAELKQLQDELNKKAAELAEAGKKLQEVARKIAPERRPEEGRPPLIRIEGLPPIFVPPPHDGGHELRGFILRKVDNNWMLVPMPPDGGRFFPGGPLGDRGAGERGRGEAGQPQRRSPPGGEGVRGGLERRPPPPPEDGERQGDRGGPRPGGAGRGRDGAGRMDGTGRMEELERRLEAVMRQLDEIRREIGPRRGPGGEPPPPPPPPRRGEGRPERKPLDNPPEKRQ